MKRRLILSLFYMGLIATIVSMLATVFVYQSTMSAEIKENLANELRLLRIGYEKLPKSENLKDFSAENFRITLIDPSGKVLFESDADAEKMENHLDRPEIISALETGKGSDTRISSTLGAEDYYYAEKLEDGNILRVSTDASSALSVFGNSFYILAAIIIIIAIVSVLVSMRITKRILAPIKKLSESLDNTTLYESDTYPELIPLLNEIKHQRSIQSDMRQEFTANVSHELKTPLTSISGYAELIENGITKEEDSKRFAAKIHTEASRMLTLIGDIIKLSKLDTGYENEPSEDVDLLEIANECRSNLSLNAEKKGISITVFGESSAVKGVRSEIYELVYNLVDNAIRYNRQYGNVDLTVYDHEIKVSDTGIGISEEHKQKIFERFYRVDKSRSKETGGTGLGLSIVKHIAEKHHAEITVTSTLNVGTDISVRFKKEQ